MANTLLRIGYVSGSGGGAISQYPDFASFPPTGSTNALYCALDTAKLYVWDGTEYIEASPSLVTSVNTQVGDVVLDKADIGLDQVDNTSDADKPISDDTQAALDAITDISWTGSYNNGVTYSAGQGVMYNGASYVMTATIGAAGYIPPAYPGNWRQVTDYVSPNDIGLGNVDNTSDLDKPVSDDVQDALDLKYDASNPAGYVDAVGASDAAPVQSVASKVGDVLLDKNDVGLGNVDNTSDLNKAISTATQTALNNLESSFVYTQVVYVDKNKAGTYTPDGSINKPYKSIEAMYTAITDASASKRYACLIAPGTYTEASTIRIKGWIDLSTFATDTVIITVSGGATLKWSNNNPGRVFIKDIGFTSGLEVLNDDPTGTSGLVFDLDNVDAPSLIFRGRGGGRDYIQLRNDTRFSGNCTIQSGATTIFDSTGIGTLIMNDDGCVAPDSFGSAITASLRSNYIGAIQISATSFDIYTDIWGTIVAGNMSIVSNAPSFPCYYNYDATSYPLGTVTLTGTNPAQLVRTSKSESISYTPTISGNWTAPAPEEVRAALDNLAANKISTSQKGAANGVAPLNASTKIDSTYLPAYVDDVLEFANLASFPVTGSTGIIYVAIDTNLCYRWSGSTYIEISPSPVTSVNGQTNAVSLDASDIPFTPTGLILSTDTQNAIVEVENIISSATTAIYQDTKEPTGFINRTDSTISFDDSTRIFTIAPVSTSFSFYIKGTKFTKTTAQTVTIPDSSGSHYIYFNTSGVLVSTQAFNISIIEQDAYVSLVYWNTDTTPHSRSYFAEERHGITMDGTTHAYLHTIFGARYLSGLALGGFTIGDGSLDSHAQFTSDSGSIRDEDILHTIGAQTQIPILFRQGQLWRKKAADNFPVIYSGSAGYTGANGRLPYNQYTGGAWQLTQVSSNKFVLVHYFATNDVDSKVIGIQGIAEYNNIPDARNAASTEITTLSDLPFTEFVPIGTVIFQTNTYTNAIDARVVPVNGANYVDFRGTQLYTPAGEATEHSLLSGLADDDHIQYHNDTRGDIRYYTKSEVDSLISGVTSPGDIDETSFSINNSQAIAANITGLAFANATVRSFQVFASVYINATSSLYEEVKISGIQKGSDWDISVISTGDESGVQFTITTLGQIQYTSSNYTGFVSGSIKFRALTTSV